jgi:putative CocE/NonD family hydrolase
VVGGYRDDRTLAARPDVLTFTGPPLAQPLDIFGNPVVELAHSSDNPHADLFVRVGEVDAKGRSRNVSDGFVRLDPAAANGVVRLELDAIAHRFTAGHRIRLLIAGGSFPRWERNLGTGDDPANGTAMAPSHRGITLADSRVLLPVLA